jgi:hypothetical protein
MRHKWAIKTGTGHHVRPGLLADELGYTRYPYPTIRLPKLLPCLQHSFQDRQKENIGTEGCLMKRAGRLRVYPTCHISRLDIALERHIFRFLGTLSLSLQQLGQR